MLFSSQGFSEELLKALEECGYQKLTPIQQQALPVAKRGQDILATAQTGTGKTAAFALPIINHLLKDNSPASPYTTKALILAPTRELVAQIADNISAYVKYTNLKVVSVYGGVKMSSQERKLSDGADIVVATPGRLWEHIELENLNIENISHLVFDEADRILDMGFISKVRAIMMEVNSSPQIMMFSATVSKQLNALAADILRKPKRIEVERANTTASTISHVLYPVDGDRKTELLAELIGRKNWQQVLVFVNYKETANNIVKELKLDGIKAVLCHGDRAQSARRRALDEFKSGQARVMVATDVAARGLDIESLPHVVNYDMPFLAEDYVHRIGRTGRAGQRGSAVSFVNREEELTVMQVEQLIGQRIKRIVQSGYEIQNRDAFLAKLNSKPAFKERRSRVNNPDKPKDDQFSAERRLRIQRHLKSGK
ncbi:DEAD/DEAH box helicase [Paraferrimonas sp. SM1919]|uniref:DEAD/DEAH box helicase n=1 Tax=Paraferrimonas sp. SM1919 TaxID=2662263 RepID=UPI0013CF789D|nr:DEAD/DEAH box helicase [Paraferrimonas sp. SM1919]